MSKHRKWRKLVKKLQRKKKRQKIANENALFLAAAEKAKQCDPAYKEWLEREEEWQAKEQQVAEKKQQAAEEAWLQRELMARLEFEQELKRRAAAAAAEEAVRQQQLQAYEAQQAVELKLREEKERQIAEANAEFERKMQLMEEYLENEQLRTPPALQEFMETHADQKLCELFARTNCCKFNTSCYYNHRQPLLSNLLLLPHFFKHPLLELCSDALLELSERDLWLAYNEFFTDVVPELERYGAILNVRTLRNTLPHLRGHVFVEYTSKRSALNALIHLQGRFYGGRKLYVQFSYLSSWRQALCAGMMLINRSKKTGVGLKVQKLI